MPNQLHNSTSPYLLQHAENPVDWYPWSIEALTLAREQDKPIFLSIGYAACHWCHVMAHESFEDAETATIMNEHFINIKVDREERPDLDSVYMDAVVAMTGQGGWPMSVFLTPEGKPFYGGTYFPPVPRYNMPSFKDLLLQISALWNEDRSKLLENTDQLTDRITSTPILTPTSENVDPSTLPAAVEAIFRGFDWTQGGWGDAPKFPQSPVIEFLMRHHDRTNDKLALDMAVKTLEAMVKGGMYDLIGGGFHRYSVDKFWLVPHFEKMLYDNAQLVETYLHAWQITGKDAFRDVALDTLEFLDRDFKDPAGGYYSSLDADSEGEEGTYYLWSNAQIVDALEDENLAEIVREVYGITEAGNFEGKNIPTQTVKLSEAAERRGISESEIAVIISGAKKKLLSYRSQRIRPGLDDKILTSWNGLTLIALSKAAKTLSNKDHLMKAQKLANFLLKELVIDGNLMRSWRQGKANFSAYLEDHAALALGLLELYQADFNSRWFHAAYHHAEEILGNFQDPNGGFFDTRNDHEQLIARPKSLQDSPTPSGNTLAALLLLKLFALTGENRFYEPAESVIRAMQENAVRHPSSFGGWLCAADIALGPQLQLAVIGKVEQPGFIHLVEVANHQYTPRLVVAAAPPNFKGGPQLLEHREQVDGKPTAFLCQGFACRLPTTSPDELKVQIEQARRLVAP